MLNLTMILTQKWVERIQTNHCVSEMKHLEFLNSIIFQNQVVYTVYTASKQIDIIFPPFPNRKYVNTTFVVFPLIQLRNSMRVYQLFRLQYETHVYQFYGKSIHTTNQLLAERNTLPLVL